MQIASSVRALATVSFLVKNYNRFTKNYTPVLSFDGTPLEDTNYLAELWGGPTPSSLLPARTFTNDRVIARFSPLLAGVFTASSDVNIVGAYWPDLAWLQIRVWDGRLGETYEQAVARGLGGTGESPLFYAPGGTDFHLGLPPPTLELLMPSFRVRPMNAVILRSVRRESQQIILDWHPGFNRYQIQWASALGMPWNDLGPPIRAVSLTNDIGDGNRFFRIVGRLD